MNALLITCAALLALVVAVGLSLPALTRVVYGAGHHRRPARLTLPRAPEFLRHAPAQAPRPVDPPSADGAVRAGATPKSPAPVAAPGQALLAAVGDALDDLGGMFPPSPAAYPRQQPAAALPSARQLPQSHSPGLGQPKPIQLPDGHVAVWEDGRYRIRPGELPRIRPYLTAWQEHWDTPARVSA